MVVHSEDTDEHEEEDCSPFCTCVCCSYPIVAFSIQNEIAVSLITFSEISSVYKSPYSNGFFAKIWQPPKIS